MALIDVDPAKQWEWHETYRDMAKNQYRTSYTDMVHFKEVNVKSDYPSGYGGHIPSIRHDVLHRNSAFDRGQVLRRNDPSRDAHPSFANQIAGIPTYCAKPQGAKKNPTWGVIPHDGTTTNLIAPWAVATPVRTVPSHRSVPTTLARARSLTSLQTAGAAVASPPARSASSAQLQTQMPEPSPMGRTPGGASDRLKRQVNIANAQSSQQRMPSEQEMLMTEMYGQEPSTDMMEEMPEEEAYY